MQLPLSGKLYLLKLASKHLFCPWVSVAFSLASVGSLESQPHASCLLQLPFGLKRTARRVPLSLCASPLSVGSSRIPDPDSSSQSDSGSTNPSRVQWLYGLAFQLPPSLQSLIFPSLTLFLEVFHFKTFTSRNCSRKNKSLEIARKQWEHPSARGKKNRVWSYQIWFVSKIVTAPAQGSGDGCGKISFLDAEL